MTFEINNDKWEIKEINNAEMNILCGSDLKETFTHGNTVYSENVIYINQQTPNKRKTLYHELMHLYLYEYGHNQWNKQFDNEDICEISASSHDFIHNIVEKYFDSKK